MKREGKKRVIIAGAGMSGLTAGAYLLKKGFDVLILEKSSSVGGLVSSFSREGFVFDTGPRAIGNGGILIPMLEDLQIDLPLVKGEVSTGIKNKIIHYNRPEDIKEYIHSLKELYPYSLAEIKAIERYIKTYNKTAQILNKRANPFFKNLLKEWKYLFFRLLPWLPSFLAAVIKMTLGQKPIETTLNSLSSCQSLKDIISQHFFKGTPAPFVFGYFENFLDYQYPVGGTGELPGALRDKITLMGGKIQQNSEITEVDPSSYRVRDNRGNYYSYNALLWTGDLKSLYTRLETGRLSQKNQKSFKKEKQKYLSSHPGESVFSLFLAADEKPEYFQSISKGHFIYTPSTRGLGELHRKQLAEMKAGFHTIKKEKLFLWLQEFCIYNSYEISIPVLKDPSLAPVNKTGLIISFLFDGELVQFIHKAGWYREFKEKTEEFIIQTLEKSIYPGLGNKIIFKESATPVTLMNMFNTTCGAVTGWSLEEKAPVPDSLFKIMKTAQTTLPYIYKAGQWSYSPSGVPIAILTGRIAAHVINKKLRKSNH